MSQFLYFVEDAVNKLKEFCKDENGLLPKSFEEYYCGVTNDLERRAGEHNATFLGAIEANTVQGALDVEARMHEEGFNTGEQLGNAGDDSKFVYVYKMGRNTKE